MHAVNLMSFAAIVLFMGACSKRSDDADKVIPAASADAESQKEISSCNVCGGFVRDPSMCLAGEKCLGGMYSTDGSLYVPPICYAQFTDSSGDLHTYQCKKAK